MALSSNHCWVLLFSVDVVASEAQVTSTEVKQWICPAQRCGHAMKPYSAGHRARMIRNHPGLIPALAEPCKCSRGCQNCVPNSVLTPGDATLSAPGDGAVSSQAPKQSRKSTTHTTKAHSHSRAREGSCRSSRSSASSA